MKIKYINGSRFYHAFLAGSKAIFKDQSYLNKINVYPVPDSDTGTNLASTVRTVVIEAEEKDSLSETANSIAECALKGARGNSGVIFAQYMQGLSEELGNRFKISAQSFAESVRNAVKYAYEAMNNPVEGTMVSVIRDWAEAVYHWKDRTDDFVELLSHSLQKARESLMDTPNKLKQLKQAGVVDAGAQGFVDFIEGILNFISRGRLKDLHQNFAIQPVGHEHISLSEKDIYNRYCTEAFLEGENIPRDVLKNILKDYGDSLIVAGSKTKVRIHIHTNKPADIFQKLKDFGKIVHQKVDDMKMQFLVSHKRKHRIALVTDSSCDLPQSLLEEHQIHVVPVKLHMDENTYLDKLTVTTDQFYSMLDKAIEYPTTSQPGIFDFENLFSFLNTHYDSIIGIHLSGGLSGTFSSSATAAKNFQNRKITIIDSKHISVSLGLIVLRAAMAIEKGLSHDKIVELIHSWIPKTKLFASPRTMKYLVRSGRVNPVKGFLANILNLKPIISLNEEGKACDVGKAFTGKPSWKKVVRKLKSTINSGGLWEYAIAHANSPELAKWFEDSITRVTSRSPVVNMDISPVIGVHVGLGTGAVAIMTK